MKELLYLCLVLTSIYGCTTNAVQLSNYDSDQLKLVQVSDHVFQHTSYLQTRSFGTVPCNGMIYVHDNEAIVFDTPVNDSGSLELLHWLEGVNIKGVVATHFHVDCLGGLNVFHDKGIPSYATYQTIDICTEKEKTLPQNGFDTKKEFEIGGEKVYAQYFGEGHTKDNIVGYVPSEKVLFGGCLVKALKAPKGNLADANPAQWSSTIEKLKATIPDIDIVIPGHGRNGTTALLDYTYDLFNTSPRYVFFLHNRFLETHDLDEEHPQYGRTEYKEIITEMEQSGLEVISEQRNGNVNAREYAAGIVTQIDSLLSKDVDPSHITVVGTSKGGYIAQYVSTLANNPKLNFVFIASHRDQDIQNIPEINYCGNILVIYDESDPYGVSAIERKRLSTCQIEHYKEIELHTNLGHGFLFKPLKEWMTPTIEWAKGKYD